MPKLIKLSEDHYVAVDDSKIKEVGMFVYDDDYEPPLIYQTCEKFFEIGKEALKITHSFGKELEGVETRALLEAEEIEYGFNPHKLFLKAAKDYFGDSFDSLSLDVDTHQIALIAIGNVIKTVAKNNLFSIEDIKKVLEQSIISTIINIGDSVFDLSKEENRKSWIEEYVKSLLPPTEWEIEFINGKMVKV